MAKSVSAEPEITHTVHSNTGEKLQAVSSGL